MMLEAMLENKMNIDSIFAFCYHIIFTYICRLSRRGNRESALVVQWIEQLPPKL